MPGTVALWLEDNRDFDSTQQGYWFFFYLYFLGCVPQNEFEFESSMNWSYFKFCWEEKYTYNRREAA